MFSALISPDRLVFVVAKCDLLDDTERAEVESFARNELAGLVPDSTLFFVSAKQALSDPDTESDRWGMQTLSAHLQKMLDSDRQKMLLEHALADAERLSRFFRQSIAMRRASLSLPQAELEKRRREAQSRLDNGKRSLDKAAASSE